MKNKLFLVSLVAFSTMGAVSCGGSSDSVSGPIVLTGVFVDSPVEGLSYRSSSRSGVTNSSGEFTYIEGEVVTFYIGDIVLGAALGEAEVTPLELAGTDDVNDNAVVNMLRFLQTIDEDGILDNGIKILASTEVLATGATIDFDQSVSDFELDSRVINFVSNSGAERTSLVSTDDAMVHFITFNGVNYLAGTWTGFGGMYFTFLDSGTYLLYSDGSVDDPNCINEVRAELDSDPETLGDPLPSFQLEIGLYTYDDGTLRLSNLVEDNNGSCGFVHEWEMPGSSETVTVSFSDQNTMQIAEGTEDPGELLKVGSASQSILGSWTGFGGMYFTFLDSGTYLLYSDGSVDDPNCINEVRAELDFSPETLGNPLPSFELEIGSYTHNEGILRVSSLVEDNNGSCGFVHEWEMPGSSETVTVSFSDQNTMQIAEGTEDPGELIRVGY